MKKEIEKAIHNLKVEGIDTPPEMMELLEKYDRDEIDFQGLKEEVFKMVGISEDKSL